MKDKSGLTFAYLAFVILIVLFSIGFYFLFQELIEFNVNEDISRTLSLALSLENVGVMGISDGTIDPGKDHFTVKAVLGERGYEVPYEDILVGFDINSQMYWYNYSSIEKEGSFTIVPISVSQQDEVLRPKDKVEFYVPSPVLLMGEERVTLEVKAKGDDSQLRVFLKIPKDLYGNYRVLR